MVRTIEEWSPLQCIYRAETEQAEKEKHKSGTTTSDSINPSSEEQSTLPALPSGSARDKKEECGFTMVIIYTEDKDLDNSPMGCIHIARIIATLITKSIQHFHSSNLNQGEIS